MIELNKIYNESNCDTMSRMPDNFIDLTVTSPPYNKAGFEGFKRTRHTLDAWKVRNIDYEEFDDFMPEGEYQKWQIDVLNKLFEKTKDGGSLFYNHKVRVKDYKCSFPTEWLAKTHWNIRQEIIWDRGSTPSLNSIRFYPTTEKVYWLFKGEKPKYFNPNLANHKEVWRISPEANTEHPAQFPELLAWRCIEACSRVNETIYDPFMGSGTVAVVCKKTNRNYVGSELNPKYVDIAESRIAEIANQINLFENAS